ncbi:MAG: hypothetical protein ISS31_02815 [Kiritimatiellae bacterium]|nr:hypothetical protein [Kiritimatiellia bacterium]
MEKPLRAGHAVNVFNPCGDIRCRKLKDRNVAVFAIVQTPPGALTPPEVTMVESDGVMHVTVTPPCVKGPGQPRVDLTVFVPSGAPLNFATVDGLVEARGSEPVVIETESGQVNARVSGPLSVTTQSGAVNVMVRTSERWSQPVDIRTVTGDIHLRLPRYADVRARMRSAGRVSCDYSTRVEQAQSSHIKQVASRISEACRSTRGWWGRLIGRTLHPARPVHTVSLYSDRGRIDLLKHFPDWQGGEEREQ